MSVVMAIPVWLCLPSSQTLLNLWKRDVPFALYPDYGLSAHACFGSTSWFLKEKIIGRERLAAVDEEKFRHPCQYRERDINVVVFYSVMTWGICRSVRKSSTAFFPSLLGHDLCKHVPSFCLLLVETAL